MQSQLHFRRSEYSVGVCESGDSETHKTFLEHIIILYLIPASLCVGNIILGIISTSVCVENITNLGIISTILCVENITILGIISTSLCVENITILGIISTSLCVGNITFLGIIATTLYLANITILGIISSKCVCRKYYFSMHYLCIQLVYACIENITIKTMRE